MLGVTRRKKGAVERSVRNIFFECVVGRLPVRTPQYLIAQICKGNVDIWIDCCGLALAILLPGMILFQKAQL